MFFGSLRFPWSGIGLPVCQDRAQDRWTELAALLEPLRTTLLRYLVGEFLHFSLLCCGVRALSQTSRSSLSVVCLVNCVARNSAALNAPPAEVSGLCSDVARSSHGLNISVSLLYMEAFYHYIPVVVRVPLITQDAF